MTVLQRGQLMMVMMTVTTMMKWTKPHPEESRSTIEGHKGKRTAG